MYLQSSSWSVSVKEMAKFITIYLIVFGVLSIIVLVIAYFVSAPDVRGWDNYAKIAGIGLILMTTLSGMMISLYTLDKQRASAVELEAIKTEFAKDLEYVKIRVAIETKAYDELHQAATIFYHTLATLELGLWDAQAATKADYSMVVASAYLPYLPLESRKLWQKFWQKGRIIRETADTKLTDSKSRQAYWGDHVVEFGELLLQLRAIAESKLSSKK